jgi:hypothetical protein
VRGRLPQHVHAALGPGALQRPPVGARALLHRPSVAGGRGLVAQPWGRAAAGRSHACRGTHRRRAGRGSTRGYRRPPGDRVGPGGGLSRYQRRTVPGTVPAVREVTRARPAGRRPSRPALLAGPRAGADSTDRGRSCRDRQFAPRYWCGAPLPLRADTRKARATQRGPSLRPVLGNWRVHRLRRASGQPLGQPAKLRAIVERGPALVLVIGVLDDLLVARIAVVGRIDR